MDSKTDRGRGGWLWLVAPTMVLVPAAILATSCPTAEAQKPAPAALNSVTAERFVLVDGQGRERAKLGLDASGSPRFDLIDAQGESRAVIRLDRDGAATLRLCDGRGQPRAGAVVEADGGASVGVTAADGQFAGTTLTPGGVAGVQVHSAAGGPVWVRGVAADGARVATGD